MSYDEYYDYDEDEEDEEDIYDRKMYEAIEKNDIITIQEISHPDSYLNEKFINYAISIIDKNSININTIYKLIDLGFKVTINSLNIAIRKCSLNKLYELIIYKLLNENKVKPDIESLYLSIDELCNIKIVQLILSNGVKPNINTIIKVINSKYSVLINFFADNYKNMFNYDLLNSNISDKIPIDIIRLIVSNEKYINRKNKNKQVPNIDIITRMIIYKNTDFFNVLNEFNIMYDIQNAVQICIDNYNYEMIKYFFNNGAILNDSILEYFFSRGYIYRQIKEVGNKIISLFYENGLNNDLDSFIKIFNMMHNNHTTREFYNIISSYMNEEEKRIITKRFKNDLKNDLFGGNKSIMLGGAINCCSNNDDECTICLEVMDYNNAIELKNCRHAFHRKCIEEFIGKNIKIEDNKCPICRNMFDPSNDILGVEGPLCKEKIIENNINPIEYNEIYINTINTIERILDYNLNDILININTLFEYLKKDIYNILANVYKLKKYNIDHKFDDKVKKILNNTLNINLSEKIAIINKSNISEEERVQNYTELFLNNIYKISLIIRTDCQYSKAIEYIQSNINILNNCEKKYGEK